MEISWNSNKPSSSPFFMAVDCQGPRICPERILQINPGTNDGLPPWECTSPSSHSCHNGSCCTSQAAAFGIAALSSFFNGSFPACQRIPKGPPLDPVLFNGLVCVGVFLSSLLIPVLFNQDGGASLQSPRRGRMMVGPCRSSCWFMT